MVSLRCLVFGAGAIGTYIGGKLALNDHRVGFIERAEIANKLRYDGLHLEIEGKHFYLPEPKIWTSLEEALPNGPFDFAVFALKSYDTEPALSLIAPHADSLPPFLCLQNGVDNEQMLGNVLGADKVIPGTVTSAITRRSAGDIVLERKRGLGIYAGHSLSSHLATVFKKTGMAVNLYAHAPDMKWSKMLTNLIANASCAILDMSPREILEHPGLYRLEITQFREALAMMHAQHIRVVDLPGTPVRALSLAVNSLPAGISRTLLQSSLGKGRGKKMPSLHIDLYSGNSRSEVVWLNGAVTRYGESLGIPAPVNQVLNNTLMGMVSKNIPIDNFRRQPEKLLALAGLV